MTNQETILDRYHSGKYSIPQLWKYWKLISGGNSGIFLGEVSAEDEGIWTGDELADEIGLTTGISQYSDTPWLKFILDGGIIIIPMKTIRYNLSWDDIQDANAVYGDKAIYKNGVRYAATLLKGAATDPYTGVSTGYDMDWTHGSEWNRLIHHIHDGNHTMDSEGITIGDWASYTDEELHVRGYFGNGARSWCQETPSDYTSRRALRGGNSISYAYTKPSSTSYTDYGWRPALRRI